MASILAELRPMIPVVGRGAVTGARVRVLLIERAPLLRNALEELIGRWSGISITSLASSAEWLHCQDDALPDVIVIDADNNPGSVLPLLKRLRDENLSSRVIILMEQSCRESTEFVLAGAQGLVFKDKPADHLQVAIRRVHEGELWIDRAMTAQIICDVARDREQRSADPERVKIDSLTMREHEVIALVAQGSSNKVIAARMNISNNTVRHHLSSIFDKLDVTDRLGLVIYAYRHKLAILSA